MRRLHAAVLGLGFAITSLSAADSPQKDSPQSGGASAPRAEPAGRAEDEKAIRAVVDAFRKAFQDGDARAIALLFTEDGEAVDPDGDTIQGRGPLEEHYAARFAERPGDKIEPMIESITFLAPGIAREIGRTRVLPSDGGTPITGRYTAIHIKRDGRWLIASVRELINREISHHERLKEIEWLVGDWVEETPDAVVTTSVAWADNDNFLLRSFDIRVKGKPTLTGTQRIGWDPLTKQIKSWVFDSRGGYGEGLWTRAGNQWVVKATGVRPDGRTATATQVLTFVNQHSLRWKSIDRTLGDEIEPEIEEIVMVRKPPPPR